MPVRYGHSALLITHLAYLTYQLYLTWDETFIILCAKERNVYKLQEFLWNVHILMRYGLKFGISIQSASPMCRMGKTGGERVTRAQTNHNIAS